MSIINDLYATLNANAGLQAIVGLGTSPQQSKIYASTADETADNPFITFLSVGGTRFHSLPGTSDMERQLIRINCNEDVYADAQTLGDAVFSALEGNGYQELRRDLYDSITKTHTVIIDWAFLA